jgi:hypothetical protein
MNKPRASVIFIVLLSCAAGVLAQTNSSSGQIGNVNNLEVVQKTVLPLQDILEVDSLSPDGSHLARLTNKQLCVSLISGKDQSCIEFGKERINPDTGSLRWSPDGSKIAFSEDFFKLLADSDVWLFDLASKQLHSLTPEPKGREPNCSLLEGDNSCQIDLLPQFSGDGQRIFFLHYQGLTQATKSVVNFNSVSLDDAKITTHLMLEKSGGITYAYAVAPDDKVVILNGGISKENWFVEINSFDKQLSRKVNFDFSTITLPSSFTFSHDQKYIVATSFMNNLNSPLRIIDLETDKIIKVDNNQTAVAAGWQPDGSAMLYSTRNIKDPGKNGLFILSAPGQSPRKLISGTFTAPDEFAWSSAQRIFWANNNTVLLHEVQGKTTKLLLLQLGRKIK